MGNKTGMYPCTFTSALLGKHSLRGYVVFGKRACFLSTFGQSCKCPWCRRKKNPLSSGMAMLSELCCWARFNDHFLHIPNKTPLQMGCRSRNSIWELGCRSEAVRSSCSGGACQQASLAWFVDMLVGVWGCLDLGEARAVVIRI